MTTKLTPIGDGYGIVLPSDFVQQVQNAGGELEVIRTPRGITLQSVGPNAAAQLAVAQQVMREDETVLRKLAE